MTISSIKDISNTVDRHKLYILQCNLNELSASILAIQNQNIPVINMGKELAMYINTLEDYRYLNIDVYDFAKKLLDNKKTKINGLGNDIVAIYNLGILLEPTLELNAAKFLKDFSKSTAVIIIWENETEIASILNWPTQKNNFNLNFSDTQLNKLQNAI
jgi:hypothetical protein